MYRKHYSFNFLFKGGSNAFNYVTLIMAILTLVVNVNNNINNNNNNLNQFSGNVVGNNNANANTNNNNGNQKIVYCYDTCIYVNLVCKCINKSIIHLGNIVNVMPPGKKKRKRSLRNVTTTCEAESRSISGSDMLSDASLISVKLIQVRF